ncbi:MAG: hypothetical protein ACRDWF_16225 [Acidimicrobiia bacterium]|jgi:hypothetical protein
MPTPRLDQLLVIARFRALGFIQSRCEGCNWWAIWVDADGHQIESFRKVERISGVEYA